MRYPVLKSTLAIGIVFYAAIGSVFFSMFFNDAYARVNLIEVAQRTGEAQIRHLIEPLLDKYCRDQCKLLSVNVSVDVSVPDEIAPGFDEIQVNDSKTLSPSQARIRLLIDDKVGPISRGKLLELIQQYLDTLDYPVKIDQQIAHFPQPVGSEGKVAELRDRLARQFQNTLSELFQQFCPEQCLLADFDMKTEVVNGEESQYGAPGEYVQEGGIAVKIKDISGTLLVDETLPPQERANILEMAKLKTNYFRNVNLTAKSLRFPRPGSMVGGKWKYGGLAGLDQELSSEKKTSTESKDSSSNNTSSSNTSSTTANNLNSNSSNTSSSTNKENTTEQNLKQERFERIEKIERVESGDAVQKELQKFKVYGLIFGCSILSLLIFLAMAGFRSRREGPSTVHRVIQNLASDPANMYMPPAEPEKASESQTASDKNAALGKRYEIEQLIEELMGIYSQQPRVAKHVFSRVITEEGVETTAKYIHIFGESIVLGMLRDPSLQSDLTELMDFYAKTPIILEDSEKLDLLRKLHNRTVASKLIVLGNRSSNLFDYLAEMDSMQILELIKNESITVKSIVLTQCDSQKRSSIYAHLEEDLRMQILTELSRIDHLPRDYIFNVANALKRKRRDNPKLNTESLPGSEVLLTLLERTGTEIQKSVLKSLEVSNPDSARLLKSKLVSLDTLGYLRDAQLLEVVLSLKHEELLQFLKGAPSHIRTAIFSKSPKELIAELEEELATVSVLSRDSYQAVERKVLNRMKLMSNEGLINLIETNERMYASMKSGETGFVSASSGTKTQTRPSEIKKVGGW